MSTSYHDGAGNEGGTPAAEGSAALRVARGGIRTVRDCTNLAIGGALDSLTGHLGTRNGNLLFRGLDTARKFIETGQRAGQHHEVADNIRPAQATLTPDDSEEDALRQEEAALTARLEAIRERRGA